MQLRTNALDGKGTSFNFFTTTTNKKRERERLRRQKEVFATTLPRFYDEARAYNILNEIIITKTQKKLYESTTKTNKRSFKDDIIMSRYDRCIHTYKKTEKERERPTKATPPLEPSNQCRGYNKPRNGQPSALTLTKELISALSR